MSRTTKLASPLTNSENVEKVDSLAVSKIINQFKEHIKLDVSDYFKNLENIEIYKCSDSGLKFYYPFGLAGDGAFYDFLYTNSKGYYSEWKWEFGEAAKYIKEGDNILELGCGAGYFLESIKSITPHIVGLELNPKSIVIGEKRGLKILPELIQDYAPLNEEKYDAVLAFQLFEHLENVSEMIEYSLMALKKGGKFIIAVPNNSSPIFKLNKYHTLNLPPHHVLLWDEKSLASIAKIYNLRLISLQTQPTNKQLKSEVYRLRLNRVFGEGFLSRFIHATTRWIVKELPSKSINQSILAVYEK